jgi:hypothetical protein
MRRLLVKLLAPCEPFRAVPPDADRTRPPSERSAPALPPVRRAAVLISHPRGLEHAEPLTWQISEQKRRVERSISNDRPAVSRTSGLRRGFWPAPIGLAGGAPQRARDAVLLNVVGFGVRPRRPQADLLTRPVSTIPKTGDESGDESVENRCRYGVLPRNRYHQCPCALIAALQ